jgi:hypothetical protein
LGLVLLEDFGTVIGLEESNFFASASNRSNSVLGFFLAESIVGGLLKIFGLTC